jgi:hypothetical protein
MTIDDILNKLKIAIQAKLPVDITISSVDFEGPEVVVYTKEPRKFADNADIIRNIAKDMRKRIVVRPDPSVLLDPDDAVKKIKEIVPEEAGITNFYFDIDTGELTIEAEKPGLVIGRYGATLRDITREVSWTPKVARTPPIKSNIVDNIRQLLRKSVEERKTFLKSLGRKIHREISSKDQWVRVTTLGGAREVGRSCFLLSTPESRVMIDCGINMSAENGTPYLYVPEVNPISQIDAVVVTHAHLDHSGLVPLLFKYGYDGPVYCTPPTRDLMSLLQLDYLDVSAKEGKKIPYESNMVREEIKHTITLNYGDVTDIAPDIKLTLHNSGHILGSSIAHFHIGEGLYNVAITGDFKFEKTRLFDSATNDFPRVETLIMEATYGGARDFQTSRREAEKKLQEVVRNTVNNNGVILIPAFSVGRSQEVMLVLEEAIRKGSIPKIPVYLDGMIWEATAIHTTHPEYLNSDLRNRIFHKGQNPFLSECFVQVDSSEMRSKIINEREPAVILSTSGMLNGGPIMEYLRAFGPDEENALIFVGYQAEGTLGRRIQKGWTEVPISSQGGRTETMKINLNVETIDGFSGHSDRKQLVNYVKKMKPKPQLVLTEHGDERTCLELASGVYKKTRIETRALVNLETIRLI